MSVPYDAVEVVIRRLLRSDNCSCDDISDEQGGRVRVMSGFLVRGIMRIRISDYG